jgi:hypothetical protein
MPSPKINPMWLLPGLAGAVLLAFALYLPRRQTEQPHPALAPSIISSPKPISTPVAVTPPARPATDADPRLKKACDGLRAETNGIINRQTLAVLRLNLSAMPKDAAVAAIRQFLDAKADASTHLGFKLASNGMLDEAPTLRTFLLDELGRLDPAAAADYSKVILASMDSSDEWAVALRNLATGDPSADGRALLAQKTAQMLQHTPWQQNPSAGFLEAFDVAVYLGGTGFVPTLSGLVRSQDNPAVAHAAFLALDRLVINEPAPILQAMENDPAMMAGRESTRADYFARANVSDPQQRQILESYLLNRAISTSELQTFASVYPNANFMVSANLLTPANLPSHDALINLDGQSLTVAQQWLTDPRFAQVAPELQTITQRLTGFLAQARQNH